MNVWADGFSALRNEWQLAITVLAFIAGNHFLIKLFLKKIFGNSLTSAEYISLGSTGWIVPAIILSLLWYFAGLFRLFWILLVALILFIIPRFKPDPQPASAKTTLIFLFAFSIFIVIRLAFISQTNFPLYFDSASHYAVIKNIMSMDAKWLFNWLSAGYYHIGFHFLAALLASIAHAEITRIILILGQIILACIPFAFFFPVFRKTRSNTAAWFAVLLSAFGWYMPAHVVEWGKYPALTSLGSIFLVLNLAFVFPTGKDKNISSIYWFLGISALAAILIHSRSLIVFGIVFIASVTANWWSKRPQRSQNIFFFFLLAVLVTEIVIIQKQNILAPLLDPYLIKGIWMTSLVIVLSIFAFKYHPQLTFISIMSICLLLAGVFTPMGGLLPGRPYLTLIDRPFVEMILFLPLSLLGGLGLAGLEKYLQGSFRHVGLVAIGIILVHALFFYDPYPSGCCAIVGNDDAAAMDWMAGQLPVKARIGISSTGLKVIPSDVVEGIVGTDAGVWITPLTGRETILLPYDSRLGDVSTLQSLCQKGIDYLYAGEAGQTFDIAKINSRPGWYTPILSMPKVKVYRVTGCEGSLH